MTNPTPTYTGIGFTIPYAGGQKVSPQTNVTAPAGLGGDLWGANGGGIVPYPVNNNTKAGDP